MQQLRLVIEQLSAGAAPSLPGVTTDDLGLQLVSLSHAVQLVALGHAVHLADQCRPPTRRSRQR
ncbi:hypothetical protein ACFCWV_00220 [Streptomyces sp. NPDC056341]|uniref:hypothetical protein n=1 Tax=Streptomyces sp. NPDC056341 TaxID=3345788 RepID=UPI0035D74AF8